MLELLLKRHNRPLCLSIEHPDHGGSVDPWQTALVEGKSLRKWRDQLNRVLKNV